MLFRACALLCVLLVIGEPEGVNPGQSGAATFLPCYYVVVGTQEEPGGFQFRNGDASILGMTEAFAKRDVSSQPNNAVVSIQKNLDNFRRCLDQNLATAVGDVNEKHLQPVFSVIGESLNRVSKAFDDLTATTKKPDLDLDF